MPIIPNTPQSEIDKLLKKKIAELENAVVRRLEYIGMFCIAEARASDKYTDQTGNLRSSIGFSVLKNGKEVKSFGFELVKNGQDGQKEGKEFLTEIAKGYNEGIVLIVVAGMNYAAYVEAKGLNVLASSEIKAKEVAKKMIEVLGKK